MISLEHDRSHRGLGTLTPTSRWTGQLDVLLDQNPVEVDLIEASVGDLHPAVIESRSPEDDVV